MSQSLKGKVALVTGASRGIGRAIAVRLGRDGALVAVHYARNKKSADETVRAIEAAGGAAFALGVELGTLASVDQLFKLLDAELNKRTGNNQFDILVNNAGVAPDSPVETATEAVYDEVFAVNVKVPFFVSQKALPRLREGGRIINISSGVTRIAFPQKAAYAMTKGALNILTLELAQALGRRNITVNSLAPGFTDTDMAADILGNPQGREFASSASAFNRVGQPDDIADAAAFLASNDGRWVTGQYLDATGGARL
ncbi:MAG TPA: SDR family oxidoreductase [Candidatus Limnocylindrales bacterium]|nr:SDR family oxidoreductase [Candidatus Limnocylindrales bacterium]